MINHKYVEFSVYYLTFFTFDFLLCLKIFTFKSN